VERIRIAFFGRRVSANWSHKHGLQVANFVRQIGLGKIDIETFGVAMPEEFRSCKTNAPHYGVEFMKKTWEMLPERPDLLPVDEEGKPIPIPEWATPTHWYMLGGWHQGQCGQANFGGNLGRTNTDMGCGITTTAHEMGHMRPFRLRHSNARDADGTLKEYKDRSGKMGSSAPMSQHMPHMLACGLLDTDEGTTVRKNCRLTLVPWEVPKRSRYDEEYAFARITDAPYNFGLRGWAYVSVRKMRGYPWAYPQSEPSVFLHVGNQVETWLVDRITLGETSTVFPGVRVKYLAQNGDSTDVEITFDADNTPVKDMTVMSQGFPPEPGVLPPSGIYGDPHTLGQGVDLQSSEKGTALFWYTFDDEAYRQWYVAQFEPGSTESDLYTVEGANFSDPTAGERVKIGTVRFTEHQGQVHLDFDTSVHGRGSIPMEAVPGVKGHPAGAYYNPARNGEGFTLRFIGDRVVGYWYTYEPTVKKGTWFYLDGEKAEKATFDVKMYRARAPFNAHNVGEPFLFYEGTATLSPVDPDAFEFRVPKGDYAISTTIKKII
jgi:hypothetical protein